MIWLNSIFLMGQSFIPFPTTLMGEYPTNSLAVSLFGTVMAVNTLLFIALQSYVPRNLLKPEMSGAIVPHLARKSFVGVVSYLLGVAATFVDIRVAFFLYAITPLFFITPPQVARKQL
jgi:TMEM175 potassium channel family protein